MAVERLPVFHHSEDYIFIAFGITEPIVVSLKMELLMYTLEGVSRVANFITAYEVSIKTEAPIFYL